MTTVAVIGGGISGLAAAYRLLELDPTLEVKLFEASPRLGGVLQTQRRDGFLLEHAADNFITTAPWATDLCRRLGLAEELLPTNAANRRALVLCRGRLQHVPDGFQLMAPARLWPILTTPILSLRGKLRLLCEPFIPPRQENGDESLAGFVRRRLGREAYERLVQPLVGGIYTADAEKLSIQATLARFADLEQRHGSLAMGLRAARQRATEPDQAAGARYSLFVAPRGGISTLIDSLASRLPRDVIVLDSPISRVQRTVDGRWQLDAPSGSKTFDRLIIAAPAHAAANLLQATDAQLAGDLQSIHYAPCAIVLVAYRRAEIGHPLDGFGIVVPEIENRRILAASFPSNKFPGRAPDDHVLIRVFVGGARHPEQIELSDEQLKLMVTEELSDMLSIRGQPRLFQAVRWRNAMPQYHLGHVDLVRRIEARAAMHPGLALAGNAYHGVGIPDCIHGGELAAEAITKAGADVSWRRSHGA